jgi:uncharacterized membrane protein
MHKGRLEAFSDGVIAIIITIMVLEMKVPHGTDLSSLEPLFPVFLSYILSFIYVGIYWNNHHHLMQVVQKVRGPVLWANMHLLFWLSLFPFTTGWMGENHFAELPVALYGTNLLCAAVAYYILTLTLLRHHEKDSKLAVALGNDFKGKISVVVYALAVPLTFVNIWFGLFAYQIVAVMWLLPDKRMEKLFLD